MGGPGLPSARDLACRIKKYRLATPGSLYLCGKERIALANPRQSPSRWNGRQLAVGVRTRLLWRGFPALLAVLVNTLQYRFYRHERVRGYCTCSYTDQTLHDHATQPTSTCLELDAAPKLSKPSVSRSDQAPLALPSLRLPFISGCVHLVGWRLAVRNAIHWHAQPYEPAQAQFPGSTWQSQQDGT